jgi:HSP20 family molecular chaperone IbpA
MSRQSVFGSPLFLGFDHLEQMLDRVQKGADGYPPYNIEQIGEHRLRITLAVAGFSMDDLQITQEDNQLVVRGRQQEDGEGRVFLHRGSPPASSSAPSCWPRASRSRARSSTTACCMWTCAARCPRRG